ncbi:GNAT family N-acetyltransferase [Agromyces allii]|uniref:GNAT family N-acetyltransferase n=1 Tax=Agromyces allii TaxID=393607 RepID=A0ABN2R6W4_9MICO|nr:GNAT family N-acetyltransferase [Agromyces allii]
MHEPLREIRLATPSDHALLERIENDADELFIERFRPASWRPAPDAATRSAQPGFVLVALDAEISSSETVGGEPIVVGFAQVLEHDGFAHLEQLSVAPSHARRGHGRRLVEAAIARARALGYDEITLRTYADVPWNAPFYRSCGFVESEPATAWHRELAEHDVASALATGIASPRIQMTAR